MRYTLSVTYVLLFSLGISSQNLNLNGKVLDKTNFPIAYANVILNPTDNPSSTTGAITDEDGRFVFKDIIPNTYRLTVSFLGFETFQQDINLSANTVLPNIILQEKIETLGDAVIIAKRPTIKRMVDRLVFNVENSTLSNNNILDVLKHTPGVIVSDGTISVKNVPPVIYMNDRRIYLSPEEVLQLLEATPANKIKSVEVITNPPAKYDAEGGAVLNIVSSKNIILGYHGSVFGNYQQGFKYPKYAIGTSHFYKSKKISTYINYNIDPRRDFRNNFETVNFFDNGSVASIWETDFNRTTKSANQNISASLDYDINQNNSLNFNVNTLIAPRNNSKRYVNSLTKVFDANKNLDSSFRTLNNLVSEKFNLALSLGYSHNFKRNGEKISADVHHTNYEFSEFQDVNTGYFFPNASISFRDNRFQTFSSQDIRLITGQVDYKRPFEDGAIFETGIKAVDINSNNVIDQYIFENNTKETDVTNSDVFLYDEKNYAGYLSYEKDWEHWSIKAGLRVERTETKGKSLLNGTNTINTYTNVFPSFYVLHRITDNDEIYFSYNKRIDRPRYRQLNPFRYFLSDNSFISGDPNLLPEIDDSFILGYTINNIFTFEVYYRYEDRPTIELPVQDNENRLLKAIFTNIDHNESYGLDFTTYTSLTKNWNLYVLSSYFFYENNFFAVATNNELLTNTKWSVYANVVNYFNFLKDNSLTADVGVDYISAVFLGPSEISGRLGVDININKSFWNNKASISVGIRDLFNTRNFTQNTNYTNQNWFLSSNMENRLFVAGFNYKFGNHKLKIKKGEIDLIERDRLETNN